MMSLSDWIDVVAIIMGPILAVVISIIISVYINKKNEENKRKYDILSTLMQTRGARHHQDHVYALNLIDIIYYKDKNVIDCYRKYIKILASPIPGDKAELDNYIIQKEDAFNDLLKAMGEALNYSFDKGDLGSFKYTPKIWVDLEDIQLKNSKLLLDVLQGHRAIPIQKFIPPKSNPFPPPPRIDPNL